MRKKEKKVIFEDILGLHHAAECNWEGVVHECARIWRKTIFFEKRK